MSPQVKSSKSNLSKDLRLAAGSSAHHLPTDVRPMPPDLALVVERWPDLPPDLRAGIVAMVRAASKAT